VATPDPNPNPTVREMRLWLHRMDAELKIIERRVKEMRDKPVVRQRMSEERRALRELLAEPRSPWTHSSSSLSEDEQRDGPWESMWKRLFSVGSWADDARRRVRSADRVLRHYDPAKPKLQHLKQRRRGAA
jgi:hypothetical protein